LTSLKIRNLTIIPKSGRLSVWEFLSSFLYEKTKIITITHESIVRMEYNRYHSTSFDGYCVNVSGWDFSLVSDITRVIWQWLTNHSLEQNIINDHSTIFKARNWYMASIYEALGKERKCCNLTSFKVRWMIMIGTIPRYFLNASDMWSWWMNQLELSVTNNTRLVWIYAMIALFGRGYDSLSVRFWENKCYVAIIWNIS